MKTTLNSWADLKEFANSLSEEQLTQPVVVWGEGYCKQADLACVEPEDMINPSGEGCEPVSAYLNDPEYGQKFVDDEPVPIKAGDIRLYADVEFHRPEYFKSLNHPTE